MNYERTGHAKAWTTNILREWAQMYNWRKMSRKQREEVLKLRKQCGVPWHGPPHFGEDWPRSYHLTAACYEHEPIVGLSPGRMAGFEQGLIESLGLHEAEVRAWCVLPNHWHALVKTGELKLTTKSVGTLHGRSSYDWNGEEDRRGRKCWHCCADRAMRNERHTYATLNYIHNNPVHHGYVQRWQDWPYSSAVSFLAEAGEDEARRVWNEYPVLDYGKGWDDSWM